MTAVKASISRPDRPGITSQWEFVTPAIAELYLKSNTRNRPHRELRVGLFVAILTKNQWKPTHQGIAFRSDGTLADGQHRLMAIARSGVGAVMMVTRGLPDDEIEVIDQHKAREAHDVLRLTYGGDTSRNHISIARAMYTRGDTNIANAKGITNKDMIDFYIRHQEAIDFTRPTVCVKGLSAIVRSVVSRAWYTQDRDQLDRFMDCIHSRVCQGDEEQAVVAFIGVVDRSTSLAGRQRRSLYRKAEYALMAFLKCRPITKVLEAKNELFPIPDDPFEGDDDDDA
jgi:hypothetical protein